MSATYVQLLTAVTGLLTASAAWVGLFRRPSNSWPRKRPPSPPLPDRRTKRPDWTVNYRTADNAWPGDRRADGTTPPPPAKAATPTWRNRRRHRPNAWWSKKEQSGVS